MDVTPLVKPGRQIVQSYSSSRFKISGNVYETPVLVFLNDTIAWHVQNPADSLNEDDFAQLIPFQKDIDVVLLGCGEHMEFVPPALRQNLKDKGLSVEPMDTGAACRTFNVLMAEDRRVCAALFPL